MFPEAHETTIDGVPAFWTEIDESPQVTMTFGVGMRDEPPSLSGVTHLLEHLLFSSMEPSPLLANGATGPSVLRLTASGTPSELVDFVHAVTRAVRTLDALPGAEVDREKRVLEAETTDHYAQPACTLLAHRFGYAGIGKSSGGTVALPLLTLDDVVSWAGTHLTRDNLVLSFVGPPPEGIEIDLPSGVPAPRPVETDSVGVPTVVPSERHHLAFSIVTTPAMASHVACVLDHEILGDLRQLDGLIYSTDTYLTDIDEGRTALDVHLDPLPEQTIPALERLLAVLHRLRDDGVSREAVEYSLRSLRDASADRASCGHQLLRELAHSHVLGVPAHTPRAAAAMAQAVTPAAVTEALRGALGGLLIAVDDEQTVPETVTGPNGLAVRSLDLWVDSGAERPGPGAVRWRARRRGALPGFRLALDANCLWLSARGLEQRVPLDTLAFASHRGDGWIGLLDHDGRSAGIDMTDFRRGRDILDELAKRLPVGLVRATPHP
ncbi:pitrilysin family protein [Aeromicrobium sp. Root472D3]|uniref:M16 family metallopeptidase n=1 Tax=Aeromicrobium sp. Root472D3 TaxID=1736540 RepID=UPI0006F37CFD|nr:insulinase family protein [Aeromicrobium sp. Root472D3]KQX72319.1 hypothetical protein ASD10_15065 [Aeromicrobium sp. Root472D3]